MNFEVQPYIRAETPTEAWQTALSLISNNGENVVDENGKLTRFIHNLFISIKTPGDRAIPPNCGWDKAALDVYARQLISGENPGFEYTYGEQLRRFGCQYDTMNVEPVDQLDMIIRRLKRDPNTRRAIAVIYDVLDHHSKIEMPCMIVDDFLMVKDTLHLTALFRSHDFGRAYFANIYGLWHLLKHVAFEVGVLPGTISTLSVSAHIYAE